MHLHEGIPETHSDYALYKMWRVARQNKLNNEKKALHEIWSEGVFDFISLR